MPQGLQIFDAAGHELFTTADNIGRVLGYVQTTITNGSLSVSGFSAGRPFTMTLPKDGILGPQITVSGTTLSWTWPGAVDVSFRKPSFVIYGIF